MLFEHRLFLHNRTPRLGNGTKGLPSPSLLSAKGFVPAFCPPPFLVGIPFWSRRIWTATADTRWLAITATKQWSTGSNATIESKSLMWLHWCWYSKRAALDRFQYVQTDTPAAHDAVQSFILRDSKPSVFVQYACLWTLVLSQPIESLFATTFLDQALQATAPSNVEEQAKVLLVQAQPWPFTINVSCR